MNSSNLSNKNLVDRSLSSPGFAVPKSCQHMTRQQSGSMQDMQWTSSQLTSDDVYMCRSLVTRVSGLTLPSMPNLKQLTGPFELAEAAHRDTLQPAPNSAEAERSVYDLFRFLRVCNVMAMYLRTDNIIAFHPTIPTIPDRFPSHPLIDKQDLLRGVLVHELTHAVQAQHFPGLFDEWARIRSQEESIQWPHLSLGSPIPDLLSNKDDFFAAIRRYWSIDRSGSTDATFLLEGHATWVDRQVNERLFPGKRAIQKTAEASSEISFAGRFSHLIAKAVTFAPRYLAGKCLAPNPYEMGHQIFSKIYQLQAELEAAPLVAANGDAAELAPHLRGHGLAYEVLRTPGWFARLAPHYADSWRTASRSQIDLQPLRTWATSPENIVAFVPSEYVGASPVAFE